MDILSEAAQEQNNNNDPSNRLAPHGRDSNTHTHTRPNGRHNTQYINIAVTSLNTIQPKVTQTETLFTAYGTHQIFYYSPRATQARRGNQISLMYDKCYDQSITWENKGVNIPLLIINKNKIGNNFIQLRYVENFKWLTAFLLFDMHNPFSSMTCMHNVTSY